jgi:signal peptide peptidase SppA
MIKAFDVACGAHWLILPDALEKIVAIADRDFNNSALATQAGKPLDNTRTVEKRPNGVAVVPVTGPIFRYANLMTDISGATSTQVLATDIKAALNDPSVKGIVLDINSPGGEATGINELAQMIFDARGTKPINAYVGGTGASAAYWIASAADNVYADKTAILGSIGVVSELQDTSERDAKTGKKTYTIVSANAPNKRPDISTDAGRQGYQSIVDDLESTFISSVAQYRGISQEKVKTDFGRGGVFVGTSAIKAGLADKLGSLESVINQTAAQAAVNFMRGKTMSNNKQSVSVSNTADLRTAMDAGYTAEQISITTADHSAMINAARAEGHEAGKAESLIQGREVGAAAERDRITSIKSLHISGFKKERDAAITDGSTPEAFAVMQAKAIKDRGITLEGIRSDSKAAQQAAPGNDAPQSNWDKTVAKYSKKA